MENNYNFINITIITEEVILYYKTNPEIAKEQYNELVKNDRGLDKKILDGYYEKHHIIPRCMGGNDSEDNLVLLTYREHVLAHMLLSIIYPENYRLLISFKTMTSINKSELKVDLLVLEDLRIKYSKYLSKNNPMKNPEIAAKFKGENSPMRRPEVRLKLSESKKGEKNPAKRLDIRKRNSDAHKGKIASKETREKMSRSQKGRKSSSETKEKISKANGFKVQGPDGVIYDSLTKASELIGVCRGTLKNWIEKHPEKGYKLL